MNTLLRRGFWSFGLIAALLVLQLVVTMVLARSLGAENFGAYAFALSAITLLAIPASFGLPGLVLRETAATVAAGDWLRLRGLWRWASATAILLSLAVAGLGVLTVSSGLVRLSSQTSMTFLVGMLLIPFVALGNLRGAALRGLGHVVLGQIPESLIRPSLFCGLLLVFVSVCGAGALSPALAMKLNVLSAAVAFVVGLVWLRRRTPVAMRQATAARYESRTWASSLFVLGALSAAQLVLRNTDVFMLGLAASSEDVGVYKVVAQAATVISFALSAANLAIAPQIARLWEIRREAELQQILTFSARWTLVFALPVTLVFVMLGQRLLGLVFGAEYAAGHGALKILALGQLGNSMFGSAGLLLNMTRFESDTLKGVLVGAVVNVALNAFLIPPFGVEGAAWATTLSIIVWNLMLWQAARRRLCLDTSALGFWRNV